MDTPRFGLTLDRSLYAETVSLSGEIDYAASIELKPKIDEITQNCKGDLLLDLSQVTFIDSEGIKTLISAFRRIHAKSAQARVVRCSPRAMRVIKLAGADHVLMNNLCDS
ncbi:MAG: STAS domain-containing protein [Armatimonadetes bacterium]|nr:STAS domain-containing protein [Armatimonadota bacterium]